MQCGWLWQYVMDLFVTNFTERLPAASHQPVRIRALPSQLVVMGWLFRQCHMSEKGGQVITTGSVGHVSVKS